LPTFSIQREADGLELAIGELFDAISQPLGWDVEFDWAGADVEEVLPSRLPDLYSGRPVRVLAWVRGDLPETLRVRMTAMDGKHLYDVKLPPRLP
jgi:Ca-activated chloride channel family protein